MSLYEDFKSLPIDHSCIGLSQSDSDVTYYCTPKEADIIGWAGVDGIHYCTIAPFGEMIFAVSPMNFGNCVHPIARNFSDLLRLLLTCGDMAALEQCYAWDEEQYKAFLIDCPITAKQQEVLDIIRNEFALQPIEDAFSYVKKLQAEFDLSQIPYPEDYYDPDMNPAAPPPLTEWKVTYDGGFWSNDGRAGQEIVIEKAFHWGEENWLVPAVYLCSEGLVVDFCVEKDPADITAFIQKWDLVNEESHRYSNDQQEQIHQDNPLEIRFDAQVRIDGQKLRQDHGCGLSWIPDACLPEGAQQRMPEAIQIMTHYGLDQSKAWSLQRRSFRWKSHEIPDLQSLQIKLIRSAKRFGAEPFETPAVGERVTITHPVYHTDYTLTVQEVEQTQLPSHVFGQDGMEYPSHCVTMAYTIEPDISQPEFMLQDCCDSDRPRRKALGAAHGNLSPEAIAIGIIGGADGPTAFFVSASRPNQRVTCSSAHFDPVTKVTWRPRFHVKLMDDITVDLI